MYRPSIEPAKSSLHLTEKAERFARNVRAGGLS
jgi:hypothetical protein